MGSDDAGAVTAAAGFRLKRRWLYGHWQLHNALVGRMTCKVESRVEGSDIEAAVSLSLALVWTTVGWVVIVMVVLLFWCCCVAMRAFDGVAIER